MSIVASKVITFESRGCIVPKLVPVTKSSVVATPSTAKLPATKLKSEDNASVNITSVASALPLLVIVRVYFIVLPTTVGSSVTAVFTNPSPEKSGVSPISVSTSLVTTSVARPSIL